MELRVLGMNSDDCLYFGLREYLLVKDGRSTIN